MVTTKSKTLYINIEENVIIRIKLIYNRKINCIDFVTDFSKSAKLLNYYKSHITGCITTNKECSLFLGVHVAERVLSHVFKNVERMSLHHRGFDFKCGKGFMIDVKSSCRRVREKQADLWQFYINKNTIADYFLCLAFDNRESLNPEHIWLIPGKDVNNKTIIQISETNIERWEHYQIDKIKEIIQCCNILRS